MYVKADIVDMIDSRRAFECGGCGGCPEDDVKGVVVVTLCGVWNCISVAAVNAVPDVVILSMPEIILEDEPI